MNNADIDRLVDALRAVVTVAVQRGLAPRDIEHAVLWWEPYDECGSRGRTAIQKVRDFRSVAEMMYAEPTMGDLRIHANDIRKIKWPEFVLDDTSERLCECYFTMVGEVAVNESALRRIAERYVTDVQSNDFDFVTTFQVAQFNAASAFTLNKQTSFRPVSSADIEHFGYELLPVRRPPRLNKRDWICTVTQKFPMDDVAASHRSRDYWDRLIGGLGLSNNGDAWFSLLCEGPRSPFLRGHHYGTDHRIHSSPYGPSVSLGPEDINRYREMMERVTTICDQEVKSLFVAFRRFRAAAGRAAIEDKITDLAIGLESLLAPDSGTGEISFKFRMRGAALLPNRFGSVGARMKLMQKLYKARCDIVHGSLSDNSDRSALMHQATDIFRIIFDELSRTSASVKDSIAELDEEMTNGGETWLARNRPTCPSI